MRCLVSSLLCRLYILLDDFFYNLCEPWWGDWILDAIDLPIRGLCGRCKCGEVEE